MKGQSERKDYISRLMTPEEAVLRLVRNGDRIYTGTSSSVAYALDEALADNRDRFENLTVMCAFLTKESPLINCGKFNILTYFMGPEERKGLDSGITDFTSIHLSQLDFWIREVARPDVLFLEVSPPDEDGYMSYGATGVVMHDYMKEAADRIILQVNRNAPYVFGERNLIHCTEADAIVEADTPLGEIQEAEPKESIRKMCAFVAEQIPDGATLQLGTGKVANALGYMLNTKNDLGLHTEVMGDSTMNLIRSGNINNSRKTFHRGKSVVGFAYGSKELYRFLDHNESMYFMPLPIINDPAVIAKNDNMISVNNALSIDLTGQVASESTGFRQHSGIGGQLDYVRGAQMSRGGKSFILLESTFHSRRTGASGSHIVSALAPGTIVTTPRSDVQYVVTEFGCVNLKPLTIRERVRAMISIAHPDYREQLKEDAMKMGLL